VEDRLDTPWHIQRQRHDVATEPGHGFGHQQSAVRRERHRLLQTGALPQALGLATAIEGLPEEVRHTSDPGGP